MSCTLRTMAPLPESSESSTRASLPTQRRVDVLEGARRAGDRGDVQAALVGEGGAADVRRVRRDRHVADVGDEVGGLGEPLELRRVERRQTHLELKGGDDGDEVGVAAALAVAVDRALHLARAGVDGDQAVGDRAVAVVVDVHADPRRDGAGHRGHGAGDGRRQRGAVGVAQAEDLGAGLLGGAQGGERVTRVVGVGVEEVLGVVDHVLALARPGRRRSRRSCAGSRRGSRAGPS